MPKVSNTIIYPQDDNLSMDDYTIGTNSNTGNKKTQTYAFKSIFSLFYNFLGYNAFFNTTDTTTYPIGTPGCFYVFDENDVLTTDFSEARKITFSAYDTYNFDTANYFNIIVSSGKFLFKLINLEDKNNFVFLSPSNFVLSGTGTTFNVDVLAEAGLSNGSFVNYKRYLLVLEFAAGTFDPADYDLSDFTNTSGNPFITAQDLTDALALLPTPITNHSELNLDDGTNPHGTTKADVGLGNVDNTSDLNKPISTATQTALDLKLDKVSTAGVERAYIINADGSQGTKATSDFGSGTVQSVTGDSVDNTDPLNPIINAIPLSGTTVGSPVSGDIEFDENERVITKTQDGVKYSISPYNGSLGNFTLGANISAISDLLIACINATASGNSMSFVNVLNGNFSELSQSSEDGILITSTSPSAYGIRGLIDFTLNITDLDYTQKIYVDTKVPKVTTGSVRRVYAVDASNNQEMIPVSDLQPVLVSGTNIKTINSNSILGSGDLVISSKKTIEYNVTSLCTFNFPATSNWTYQSGFNGMGAYGSARSDSGYSNFLTLISSSNYTKVIGGIAPFNMKLTSSGSFVNTELNLVGGNLLLSVGYIELNYATGAITNATLVDAGTYTPATGGRVDLREDFGGEITIPKGAIWCYSWAHTKTSAVSGVYIQTILNFEEV